ncbi:tRNA lysidine(34) synthetase TilS [Pseudoalteromonas denitrificans]|uniref:tRNA(Ile)-lysidine synthase n=1 Tax=Pseudoalteromonas denitrificans DSM 6059 TaxID=1123010 RepID=A0A1I1HF63_9GAMM|nr:tRNA lysidine(34) synthetase TilS [Pseudoalteromonas denitrificans]SFC20628.1 tRNA(Ile)-lysidine synthase [Pseudoalteromonas denitrificans DSM 6059]
MKASKVYKAFSNVLVHNLKTIKPQSKTLTVALSGGVDSVVLLHLLHTFNKLHPEFKLEAIHVDHGLSLNAKNWQTFCSNLCNELDIPLKIAEVEVKKKARQSLEAIAREQRYLALFKLSEPTSVIFLGQHQDDQVETFLLQLKRGSGLTGLSAMSMLSQQQGRSLFRPLLNTSREQIEAFSAQFGIQHIIDESNEDTIFDRNFLRHEVVPLLNQRFNNFNACVSRSVDLLQQQQSLIDEISQSDLIQANKKAHFKSSNSLPISFLASLTHARQANLVRHWLAQQNSLMPSKMMLEQILNQAINAKQDAKICIQIGLNTLQRFRNELYFVSPKQIPENVFNCIGSKVDLSNGDVLEKHCGKGVRELHFDEKLSIQFGVLKARIKPVNKPGSNTVKHWLKDAKVPTWERNLVPLVFYNDTLVQIVGYFINQNYAHDQGVFWQRIEENKI